MAQVSKRKLDERIEGRMFQVFLDSFGKCRSQDEFVAYLSDILTETEMVVLAKRLAIALMLYKGYGYSEICEILKVSPPTVSKVKDWLSLRGEGFALVLERTVEDERSGELMKVIEEMVEQLVSVPKPGKKVKGVVKSGEEVKQERYGKRRVREYL